MNDLLEKIRESIKNTVTIEGPLPVSDTSYPFCSMKHCRKPYDLAKLGYMEDEFFISGKANVYKENGSGGMRIKLVQQPYKTRVLVRRPVNQEDFSGRVYLDILNATNNYDNEDLWTRIYNWCVKNGHGYIGITSKPCNLLALKYFNYERYNSLCMNGETAPQPAPLVYNSVPGTEEGLFWDMLSQTAYQLRYGMRQNFFSGWPIKYLYLTGQSQSGAYLNTYIHYFDTAISPLHLYNGYLNIVGAQLERPLCQSKQPKPLTFLYRANFRTSTPFINITSEGDLSLFANFGAGDLIHHCPKNSDTPENRCRYYEIAGAPHYDIKCPVMASDSDILASNQHPKNISHEKEQLLNDIPLAYYVVGMLEKLHIWATESKAPENIPPIERHADMKTLKRNKDGNVIGGLRPPMLQVPVASYEGLDSSEPMAAIGTQHLFTKQKFYQRYKNKEEYFRRFDAAVNMQLEQKWITKDAAENMKAWSRHKADALLQ